MVKLGWIIELALNSGGCSDLTVLGQLTEAKDTLQSRQECPLSPTSGVVNMRLQSNCGSLPIVWWLFDFYQNFNRIFRYL